MYFRITYSTFESSKKSFNKFLTQPAKPNRLDYEFTTCINSIIDKVYSPA